MWCTTNTEFILGSFHPDCLDLIAPCYTHTNPRIFCTSRYKFRASEFKDAAGLTVNGAAWAEEQSVLPFWNARAMCVEMVAMGLGMVAMGVEMVARV